MLVGLQLGGEREVAHLHALGGEQLLHRRARARARVADVDALALEVAELGDARFLARHQRERLGMHREHGAQVLVALLERAAAVVGLELDVGLRHAEIELAALDRVDVVDRAAGGFDRAANAGLGAVLVDEPADRAADGVVHAGDPAGADRDELLLRGGRERQQGGAGQGDRGGAAATGAARGREQGREHHRSPQDASERTAAGGARETGRASRATSRCAGRAAAARRGSLRQGGVIGSGISRCALQVVLEADAHVAAEQRTRGDATQLGGAERADRPAPAGRQRRDERRQLGRAARPALERTAPSTKSTCGRRCGTMPRPAGGSAAPGRPRRRRCTAPALSRVQLAEEGGDLAGQARLAPQLAQRQRQRLGQSARACAICSAGP